MFNVRACGLCARTCCVHARAPVCMHVCCVCLWCMCTCMCILVCRGKRRVSDMLSAIFLWGRVSHSIRGSLFSVRLCCQHVPAITCHYISGDLPVTHPSWLLGGRWDQRWVLMLAQVLLTTELSLQPQTVWSWVMSFCLMYFVWGIRGVKKSKRHRWIEQL